MSIVKFSTTKLLDNTLILAIDKAPDIKQELQYRFVVDLSKEDALRLIETLKNELERMA